MKSVRVWAEAYMDKAKYREVIDRMLDKFHTKDLKRINDFLSGFTFAIVLQDEKESESRE